MTVVDIPVGSLIISKGEGDLYEIREKKERGNSELITFTDSRIKAEKICFARTQVYPIFNTSNSGKLCEIKRVRKVF